MISEFMYVIKMGIFTVIMVFLMQIQVNSKSIESYTYTFITDTTNTLKLNQVARGIIHATNEGYKMITQKVKELTNGSSTSGSSNIVPASK